MVFALVLLALAPVQEAESLSPFDIPFMSQILDTVQQTLAGEGAEFWGKAWSSQVMVVDSATRYGASPTSPGSGLFSPTSSIWVGRIPSGPNLQEPLMRWAGQTWCLVAYPLPKNPQEAAQKIFAALWNGKASEMGFPLTNHPNKHLNTLEGRIWLRMELQALSKALNTTGIPQRGAVADALAFRRFRRDLTPGAANQERSTEWVAGLGIYTGIMLSGTPDAKAYVLHQIKESAASGEFEAGLAWTAAAYGLLLDQHRPDWRMQLNPTQDLALMLEVGMKLILPKAWYDATKLRAQVYNFQGVQREESERLQQEKQRLEMILDPFSKGPVLLLPVDPDSGGQFGNKVFESEDVGIFWHNAQIDAAWGTLEANDGLRLFGSHYFLPLPFSEKEGRLLGNGWQLVLKPSWQTVPGPRAGDFSLERKTKEVP